MADPTVQDRVRRYRSAQRNHRGIRRVEVQVPDAVLALLTAWMERGRGTLGGTP